MIHGLLSSGLYWPVLLAFFLATGGLGDHTINKLTIAERIVSTYAPESLQCSHGPFVRPAIGLATAEKTYVEKRRQNATQALAAWLLSVDKGFSTAKLPTVALVSSGGGYRSMQLGGGLVKAMDARESNETTKGLYQALTYHAGLSGGAWLLASLAGNDHPTVSYLQKELWHDALVNNSLYPMNTGTSKEYPVVERDVESKARAGFVPTIADAWGRFLAFQVLLGPYGGAAKTWSSVARSPSFLSVHAPYPIITALGVDEKDIYGACDPFDNSTQYEFTPHEFGSWDRGVAAFTPTETLGSSLSNGAPKVNSTCIRSYDNIGYIIGTSSNKFQESCGESGLAVIGAVLEPIVNAGHNRTRRDLYAPYPNPFYKYSSSPAVASQPELLLVDGGQANQNNPIWPFLQPSRSAEFLIVNDNSADTQDNYPNGTELVHTYNEAKAAGLTRMPFIPTTATFVEKGLNKRATFFGCNDERKLTIVYLPNTGYDGFNSGEPSSKFEYTFKQSDDMVANGVKIATQNGEADWSGCLGCAVVMKMGQMLPGRCKACFEKYCFVT